MACAHGSDLHKEVFEDPDTGKTWCCNAYTSFHIDDGTKYCKCCFATVVAFHPISLKEEAHG